MDLPPDLKELLEAFAQDAVEAVLVGGYAVAFHARPRATKDIDIALAGDEANLERATRALARFGAPSVVVEAVRHQAPTEVVFMGQSPLRVDFLRAIDGVPSEALLERAVLAHVGVSLRRLSLYLLRRHPRAASTATLAR